MQSNDRLYRALRLRQLGGTTAVATSDRRSTLLSDAKLFLMTFVGGFLFTTIFLA